MFVLFIVLAVLVRPLYFIVLAVLVRPLYFIVLTVLVRRLYCSDSSCSSSLLYIHSSGSFSLCGHCSGCLFIPAFTFIVMVLVLTFIVLVQYRILLLLCSL